MTSRWYQRPGLRSVYSYAGSAVGPNAGGAAVNTPITGQAWTAPANILLSDGNFASCGQSAGNSLVGGSDAIDVTEFAFDVPATTALTGLEVDLTGFATTTTDVTVQLLEDGAPIGAAKTVTLPDGVGVLTLGGAADLWSCAPNVNDTTFGVRITVASGFALASAFLGYVTITLFQAPSQANYNFVQTFVADDGTVVNLAVDADGTWWMENVSAAPGVLSLVMEGLTPGSYASSCTAADGEFICFSNLETGSDLPRKFTIEPQTMDRVSQVGPGACAVFSASSASATTYPIATITQPAAHARGSSYFLQSTGPGSNAPGNVVTVYYSDSVVASPDADLVAAFNSGNATFVYTSFTGGPLTQGPYTVQVTSVGEGQPPGQPRQFYYFTYVVPTSAYTFYAGSGHPGFTANYQRTLATMTTTVPVPSLTVGANAVVSGSSIAAWNATWPISQTLDSGAMQITQTSLTAGVATYSYLVVSGANPTAGQLVTITNTLNANGALNVANNVIATVTGTNIGIFTINGFSAAVDYVAQAEAGQATTAGTMFAFEPALLVVGTSTSPIYGNGTGGVITVTGTGQFIGIGLRKGVCGFITRNGYWTAPSPFTIFTTPSGTTAINASQIPIGPPNVVARYIAFTEAGANGVPGANFFTIPTPVQYTLNNVTYTATALVINDNTSTTASFVFTEDVLQNARAIDIQGNDLFNLVELGNPAWVVSYASRNLNGLTQNNLQNFLNLSFDGGYNPGAQLKPLGWTVADIYGKLLVSPIFGNSFYIKNTSGGALATAGLISQSAFQDAYLVPIININVEYSARVTARVPSGMAGGTLVVDLTANGISYGEFALPFSSMDSSFATFEGTLLVNRFATVPPALMLSVYARNIANEADVEIDRVNIFPTLNPVNQTELACSYVNNRESIDGVTGLLDTSAENSQPCFGAAVVLDELFLLKERSMYSVQDSPNFEPGGDPGWGVHEVSQAVGTCGQNGFDYGDEWLLTMDRSGVYGFSGGHPMPIARELQLQNGPTTTQKKGLWESLSWQYGRTFWLRNDINNRRFYLGVALPTPNFWLPNAPASTPTQPNVILMCNYESCTSFDELISAAPIHTTMFGDVKSVEMKRKWSIWKIPSPYAAMVKRSTGSELSLLLCNGRATGKMYELVPQQGDDDGTPVYPLYTTYAWVEPAKAMALQLGVERKLASYWSGSIRGSGLAALKFYTGPLTGTPVKNPLLLRLQEQPENNDERRVEVSGQRIFIEISGLGDGAGGGGYVECGDMTLDLAPHPWNKKRGIAL